MNDFFKGAIAILLSVATVTGLLIWAIKEIFKKFLLVDSERQKNRLLLEHQKYTRLQSEQFDALKTIYANLIRTNELVDETFGIIKDGREISKQMMEQTFRPLVKIIFETDRHFRQHSIFLNDSTCKKISKAIDSLFYCLTKSSYAVIVKSKDFSDVNGKSAGIIQNDVETLSEEDRNDFFDTIKKVETVKENELQEAINIVRAEFRQIFGIK